MVKKVTATKGAAPPTPPSWPSVARPLHSPPLAIQQLLPGLIQVDNFLLSSTVSLWLSFLTSTPPPFALQPSPPAKRGEASRTNDRFGIHDAVFAERLWKDSGLEELLVEREEWKSSDGRLRPVGLNPNIRMYAYSPDAYFGPHYDDDFRDPKTGWRSEWTLLVYLTGEEDGVQGGGTAFYPNGKSKAPFVVPIKRGRAVLHQHGAACMLHEGQVVEKGTKWVLRSDVMFG